MTCTCFITSRKNGRVSESSGRGPIWWSTGGVSKPATAFLVAILFLLTTLFITFAVTGYPGSTQTHTSDTNYTRTVTKVVSRTEFANSTTSLSTTVTLTSLLTRNQTTTFLSNQTITITRTFTNSSEVSALEAEVSSLNHNNTDLQSKINNVESNASSLQSELAAQTSDNSKLQSLLDLKNYSSIAVDVTVNQGAGQVAEIASFAAAYPGYLIINGTSSTSTGYVQVSDSYPGYTPSSQINFGSGATLLVPVLPGTISVVFGNNNFLSGATATISVTYVS